MVLIERAQSSRQDLVLPLHIQDSEALFVLRPLWRLFLQPFALSYLIWVG